MKRICDVIGQLVADEQVEVAEAQGEQRARQRVADADAGRRRPRWWSRRRRVGIDRLRLERVVELVGVGASDDVRVRRLAEVDARLADGQLRARG